MCGLLRAPAGSREPQRARPVPRWLMAGDVDRTGRPVPSGWSIDQAAVLYEGEPAGGVASKRWILKERPAECLGDLGTVSYRCLSYRSLAWEPGTGAWYGGWLAREHDSDPQRANRSRSVIAGGSQRAVGRSVRERPLQRRHWGAMKPIRCVETRRRRDAKTQPKVSCQTVLCQTISCQTVSSGPIECMASTEEGRTGQKRSCCSKGAARRTDARCRGAAPSRQRPRACARLRDYNY